MIGHRPPSHLLSRLPDVTHVTLSPRSSPSIFAYCKRSKTGGGNGLKTRVQALTAGTVRRLIICTELHYIKHDVGVIIYCSGEFLAFMTSTSDFGGI